MQKYVALLRGINVGGKNKISMPELKKAFEDFGYKDVVTYINSGNIIFSTSDKDEAVIKRDCEAIIADRFNLNIIITVVSAKDLASALENAPEWWDKDPESKNNAIFVIPPHTVEKVIEQVGMAKPEYEQIAYYGNVIFWTAPIKTFSKTRWAKIVGKSVYDYVTIRNSNTTKKLLELLN